MITASIVAYRHSVDEIKQVCDCILKNGIETLYLVDHSPDDTLSVFATYSTKIEYLKHQNNGYGSGHNVAINQVLNEQVDYHIVVNPDIYLPPGVIEELAEYMDQHPEVGLIMPKVLSADGELQRLCKLLPTPMDLLLRRFFPQSCFRKKRAQFTLELADYNNVIHAPYLSGCFMFLRVSALQEVGGFDERFFMYAEDIDLSRRIRQKFDTVYYPNVSIIHAHEAASYKNLKMLKVHIRSVIQYFNKWGWFFDSERCRINTLVLKQIERQNGL